MTKHPFTEGTKLAKVFSILSDSGWHCGRHELPGTQPAKAIQIIRQHGFEIENKTQYCKRCKEKTVHRRLISTVPVADSFVRLQIPAQLRKRVMELYGNKEIISQRVMVTNLLEVDHRFPQVRWSKDENYDVNMSDEEIKKKFQLLTRQNNLWKSRYCEHCKKTGLRGTFIGIDFFAVGEEKWDSKIASDDERGCYGCFWFDPDMWRDALNSFIEEKEK